MPADSLTGFLSQLDQNGELLRISEPVESEFEIAEITRQIFSTREQSPALLFDQIRGHTIPVLTNLFGTRERICKAFGTSTLDEIAQLLKQKLIPQGADNFLDALQLLPQLVSLKRPATQNVKQGLCQQVVRVGRDVDLGLLPIPRHWPCESGPVIFRGQVYYRSGDGKETNCFVAPVSVVDRDHVVVHWDPHHELEQHWQQCLERRTQLHLAIALGGSPVVDLFAQMPLPDYARPLALAALSHNSPVEVTPARSVEVSVPANAEIVIEGILDPQTDITSTHVVTTPSGFGSTPVERPMMQVTAVTQQTNPVFPTMVHHASPSESSVISGLWERFLEQFAKLYLPEVVSIRLPTSGAGRNTVFVAIRKRFPQHAKKVCSAIWGLLWPHAAKMVVVVDEDCDLNNDTDVWFRVGIHVHPERDVMITNGPADMNDHAVPMFGVGSKMGIDATRKTAEENGGRPFPEAAKAPAEIVQSVKEKWSRIENSEA